MAWNENRQELTTDQQDRSSHAQTRTHTGWMNTVLGHNSSTLHTCAVRSPFSHATPLLILKLLVGTVQDASKGLAKLHHVQFNPLIRIEHICCGSAARVELSTNFSTAKRDKLPTSMRVLTSCTSESMMWDVDATCCWADQVSF